MTYPHQQPNQPIPHGYGYPLQPQSVVRIDRNCMGTVGVIGAVFSIIPSVGLIAWLIAPTD